LLKYIKKGLFKSTTLFCTFDIRNLYTMLPQDEALDILVEFLRFHGYTKVKGIDLETIRQLAAIVLKENVFVYGNKIYKQVLGGAMGSSFTLTLANIFMWKWQKDLARRQDMTAEFYGQYIDDIFMTWNKSEKSLKDLLDDANKWHPNIKLEYTNVQKSVVDLKRPFLIYFKSSLIKDVPSIIVVEAHLSSNIGRMILSKNCDIFLVDERIVLSIGRTGISS
ncbi:unnamed protein product, partial [Rotaria sp. Silwood1]